jgi:hypothetical protein
MKLLKRLLLGLGFAALIGHSVYLSVRVHELDLRLQAADQRPAVTGNGLVNMNATTLTTAFEAAPVQPPIEARLQILEEDLKPRVRFLGETAR